ncbi:MAG TPA: hypothetical protein K8U92_05455, partial [Aliarcobacter thereius]
FKIIKPSTILIMLFLFDNKIIIEKIASLFESLNKTEENLKKEIIELKEIKKIAEILNKDVEVFKEFFEFIDLIDIENSKNQDDRDASIEFKDYILNNYNIELELIETYIKDILVNELDKSKIVISARMHALILGLTYGCETITYKISNKLIAFDDMFGKNFDLDTIQNNIKKNMKDVLNG